MISQSTTLFLNRLSIYINRYIIVFKQQSSFTETLSGTFHKWKYADWFYDLNKAILKDKDKQFQLFFGNGTLKVKQPGLYLLYSQVSIIAQAIKLTFQQTG